MTMFLRHYMFWILLCVLGMTAKLSAQTHLSVLASPPETTEEFFAEMSEKKMEYLHLHTSWPELCYLKKTDQLQPIIEQWKQLCDTYQLQFHLVIQDAGAAKPLMYDGVDMNNEKMRVAFLGFAREIIDDFAPLSPLVSIGAECDMYFPSTNELSDISQRTQLLQESLSDYAEIHHAGMQSIHFLPISYQLVGDFALYDSSSPLQAETNLHLNKPEERMLRSDENDAAESLGDMLDDMTDGLLAEDETNQGIADPRKVQIVEDNTPLQNFFVQEMLLRSLKEEDFPESIDAMLAKVRMPLSELKEYVSPQQVFTEDFVPLTNELGMHDSLGFPLVSYTQCFPLEQYEACLNTTSIERDQSLSNQQLTVFPNPIENFTTLHFEENFDEYTLWLYNARGELIDSYENQSAAQRELDFSKRASGIYFLKVQDGEAIMMRKLIKK